MVFNDLLAPSPLGLRIEGSVEAVAVPELSSLVLLLAFSVFAISLTLRAPGDMIQAEAPPR